MQGQVTSDELLHEDRDISAENVQRSTLNAQRLTSDIDFISCFVVGSEKRGNRKKKYDHIETSYGIGRRFIGPEHNPVCG
jgi:hypothetical protein